MLLTCGRERNQEVKPFCVRSSIVNSGAVAAAASPLSSAMLGPTLHSSAITVVPASPCYARCGPNGLQSLDAVDGRRSGDAAVLLRNAAKPSAAVPFKFKSRPVQNRGFLSRPAMLVALDTRWHTLARDCREVETRNQVWVWEVELFSVASAITLIPLRCLNLL